MILILWVCFPREFSVSGNPRSLQAANYLFLIVVYELGISFSLDREKDIDKKVYGRFVMKPQEKEILEKRLKDFMGDIIPIELLPFLPCLRQQDREAVEAKQSNYGPSKATVVLIDRLKRKDRGFLEFVEALRVCGGEHIALMLDPYHLYSSEGTVL